MKKNPTTARLLDMVGKDSSLRQLIAKSSANVQWPSRRKVRKLAKSFYAKKVDKSSPKL